MDARDFTSYPLGGEEQSYFYYYKNYILYILFFLFITGFIFFFNGNIIQLLGYDNWSSLLNDMSNVRRGDEGGDGGPNNPTIEGKDNSVSNKEPSSSNSNSDRIERSNSSSSIVFRVGCN